MITVRIEPENKELQLERVRTVRHLLQTIDRKPGRVLVIRDGQLLTPDLNLRNNDVIIVRDVGSRG